MRRRYVRDVCWRVQCRCPSEKQPHGKSVQRCDGDHGNTPGSTLVLNDGPKLQRCFFSVVFWFSWCWTIISWVVVSNIVYVHPYLGKIPNLTNIFQRGWNHQQISHWPLLWKDKRTADSMEQMANIGNDDNWMVRPARYWVLRLICVNNSVHPL